MPGCIVPYCNNSSEQGHVLISLPTDEKLRAIWISNITHKYGIKDWIPSLNSYLCAVHFFPDMWESETMDSLPKFKRNAVPTIFESCITKKTFVQRNSTSTQTENNNCSLPAVKTLVSKNHPSPSTENANCPKKFSTCRRRTNAYRNRIKSLQIKNQLLIDILRTDKYRTALYSIFNEDQVNLLISKKAIAQWSDDTVQRAMKLRSICGNYGYEEIRAQGIPLPCLRVLQRIQKQYLQIDTSQPISSEKVLSIASNDRE